MTTTVYCNPENAADSAYAEIVDVTISGGSQAKMSLPHVKTHPRWILEGYMVSGHHKTTLNGGTEPFERFVPLEEATTSNPALALCDYSGVGRYQLAGTCERIVATFRYDGTGKLLVTETFPMKLITSSGKAVIDR